jgi:hypothetical protein
MNSIARWSLISGGLGAGTMFMLDPARGARRRALVRDKLVWVAHKTRDAAGATSRDLGNRLSGTMAETRARWSDQTPDDWTLCERVRAELGRVSAHPRAICVSAQDGTVTLSGDVLESEGGAVSRAVRRVRGVKEVVDRMERHVSANAVPSLQGESARPRQWSTWLTSGWPPRAMLVAATGVFLAGAAAVTMRRAA